MGEGGSNADAESKQMAKMASKRKSMETKREGRAKEEVGSQDCSNMT